ncbi:hypothetical protein QJS10_CPB20g00366 [Acorus calamus]|uniref:DNA-directed RNA polymerase subunit n=1 Tax=Acorus calamus TaxID=4465 RepID=A0AAV9C822_ACOCL|nr:hypothetical protein QJS10_CPB20g00148 [Acorus calamus]KAK1286645.1 hypothetical protein QJS10_CPB20g00366 [Acorus calamus]
MEFCPTCGVLLQIDIETKLRLSCPICPYICYLEGKIKRGKHVVRKEVEPIFSGEEAFKNAAKTKATCPQCNCDEAYFNQVQTRSADEPSTLFFKCTNADCGAMWSEN